jgi:Na+/phosphate symporter
VIAKHDLSRQQELETLAQQSKTQRNLASSTGGLGVGLAVGAGFSAIGSNLATVFGAADAAIGQTLSLGGMATAVGMGLMAATRIQQWMLQGEAERRQREAEKFQALFQLSTQILETLLESHESSDWASKRQAVVKTLANVKQMKRQKIDDPILKQSIQWLWEHLTNYLKHLEQERSRF